ncbi:MAG: PIG-L deacetylase family protein, partial [Planctomycetota bacterium]
MNGRSARQRWFVTCLLMCGVLLVLTGPLEAALKKPAPAPDAADGKLRIICFGAHPDDNEFRAGGVAAMWAAQGHHVKFVSTTNGDIGHWGIAGGPLAQIRTAEVERCAEIFGIETEVLDIHDGEIMPTMENRRTFVRLIREWRADIVMCHRPNDYHPDHRYSAILVQDAGYMVTVPFFCPDVPYLRRNPVFLFYQDRFQKPNPFSADIVVGIDPVIDKKVEAALALASQTLEGGCGGNETKYPVGDPAKRKASEKEISQSFYGRFARTANRFRDELSK